MDVNAAVAKLGVTALRGKQEEAIEAINSGHDVVYVFPTGTGKTLVYEAAALCCASVTVVVSPLVGLLQLQSSRLADCGVGVLQAWDGKLYEKGQGVVKVAYTTPEQLASGSKLRKHLQCKGIRVRRLVVDEAHLVLHWDDFRCVLLVDNLMLRCIVCFIYYALPVCRRPMYRALADLRGSLVSQVVACTATADSSTLYEIQRCLGMHASAVVISMPIRRPNLCLFVTQKTPRACESDLVRVIQCSSAQRVLVFCHKRAETERVAALLAQNAISASVYHGGVANREEPMRDFLSGASHESCHARSGRHTMSRYEGVIECRCCSSCVCYCSVRFGHGRAENWPGDSLGRSRVVA